MRPTESYFPFKIIFITEITSQNNCFYTFKSYVQNRLLLYDWNPFIIIYVCYSCCVLKTEFFSINWINVLSVSQSSWIIRCQRPRTIILRTARILFKCKRKRVQTYKLQGYKKNLQSGYVKTSRVFLSLYFYFL